MAELDQVHRTLLARWREAMNLVGPGPIEDHFADCGAALDFLADPAGRWADLGSGAGFPGLVFAARFPDCAVDLIESRRKRATFLSEVVAAARAADRVTVRAVRVETLPDASYDGVTARAFAPPQDVLGHAERLLRSGGRAVLLLGPDAAVDAGPRWVREVAARYVVGDRTHQVLILRRA